MSTLKMTDPALRQVLADMRNWNDDEAQRRAVAVLLARFVRSAAAGERHHSPHNGNTERRRGPAAEPTYTPRRRKGAAA